MAIRSPVDPATLAAAAVAAALFFATPAGRDLVLPSSPPVAPPSPEESAEPGGATAPPAGARTDAVAPAVRLAAPAPSPLPATARMAVATRASMPAPRRPAVMRVARAVPPVPATASMAEASRAVRGRAARVTLADALAAARARQTILGTSLAALMTPRRVPADPSAEALSRAPLAAEALFEADAPPVDKATETIFYASSADTLLRTFDVHDFSYVAVQEGAAAVPRVFVKAFPDDIADIDSVDLRKRIFLDTMLPIVLAANEAILADRARLAALRESIGHGVAPSPADARWLVALGRRYEVPDQDLETLLARVDAVPPSMALAQAAVESGWGTSSLARRGNALFGQIVADPADGIPARDGGHGYAAFETLGESVEAYTRNLNTHPAYADFRAERARLRAAGRPLDGDRLMGTLTAYSERGPDYVAYVRRLMRANDLGLFDRVRLDGDRAAPRWPRAAADRT